MPYVYPTSTLHLSDDLVRVQYPTRAEGRAFGTLAINEVGMWPRGINPECLDQGILSETSTLVIIERGGGDWTERWGPRSRLRRRTTSNSFVYQSTRKAAISSSNPTHLHLFSIQRFFIADRPLHRSAPCSSYRFLEKCSTLALKGSVKCPFPLKNRQ